MTGFGCPAIVITPVGLTIVRVDTGATVFTFPSGAWPSPGLAGDRTTAMDSSNPAFDERTQVLTIPLGTTVAAGQVNSPLGLASGQYDIIWTDYARIEGIRNMNRPDLLCPLRPLPLDQDGYGFRVRMYGCSSHRAPTLSSKICCHGWRWLRFFSRSAQREKTCSLRSYAFADPVCSSKRKP